MKKRRHRSSKRTASHAGSWYTSDASELESNLSSWLSEADNVEVPDSVLAVISPHAGYSYSGPAAGHCYVALQKRASSINRVILLGPSHKVSLDNSALPLVTEYCTPLGDIKLDLETIESLASNEPAVFCRMDRHTDEKEHSLEMQLPYLVQTLGLDFLLVPIMVGHLSDHAEAELARVLLPLFGAERTVFVISSDFCHWGSRFAYQYYEAEHGAIYKSIEAVDREGMELIERQDVDAFHKYLRKKRNTICGRHPIGVLLNIIKLSSISSTTRFVHYSQSSKCKRQSDSSVSYAAAIVGKAVQ